MIGLAEFCEKAGFQNALSERCHEYLVEKESIGVQVQKPMGMLLRFLRMCLANGEPLDVSAISKCRFSPKWNVVFYRAAYRCYTALYTTSLAGLKPVKP